MSTPALKTPTLSAKVRIELKILDKRLPQWGFPHYGSSLAAGLDLHACLEQYALCADSSYNRIDAYGVKFPTTVVPLQAWLFRCMSLGCDAMSRRSLLETLLQVAGHRFQL